MPDQRCRHAAAGRPGWYPKAEAHEGPVLRVDCVNTAAPPFDRPCTAWKAVQLCWSTGRQGRAVTCVSSSRSCTSLFRRGSRGYCASVVGVKTHESCTAPPPPFHMFEWHVSWSRRDRSFVQGTGNVLMENSRRRFHHENGARVMIYTWHIFELRESWCTRAPRSRPITARGWGILEHGDSAEETSQRRSCQRG